MAKIQGPVAATVSLPAPLGGWNVRDNIAEMAPTDAYTLTNLFPNVTSVELRGGYLQYATGLPGQVETLMAYTSGTTAQLYAISGNAVYNVSSSGAVGAPVATGLSNNRWEYINFKNAAGTGYLYAVNGVDKPLLYDGSTWTSIDGASTPAITGVTTTTLTNIALFKNRIWFVQSNSLKAWYLPTNSVGGAAQTLDLSGVCRLGGYLVAIGTWTIDAGYGIDDNIVFITNKGEVLIYRGTDPASAATWMLVGIWLIGAPVGKRCLLKYGGDLAILSLDGLLPMAAGLQSSRLDPRVALSDKIRGAFASATQIYGNNFGWQMIFVPKFNAIMVNVPVGVGNNQQQYVMNNINQSWCNFTGWNANCWELYNDNPYFGGNTYVGLAWDSGYADAGTSIQTRCIQAFNYFGQPGQIKYFTRARPYIFTNGIPSVSIGMAVDFDTSAGSSPLNFSPIPVALWDVALWDVGVWGYGLTITNNWQGITGIGYCGGLVFTTASQGLQLQWAATDIVYQPGWAGI